MCRRPPGLHVRRARGNGSEGLDPAHLDAGTSRRRNIFVVARRLPVSGGDPMGHQASSHRKRRNQKTSRIRRGPLAAGAAVLARLAVAAGLLLPRTHTRVQHSVAVRDPSAALPSSLPRRQGPEERDGVPQRLRQHEAVGPDADISVETRANGLPPPPRPPLPVPLMPPPPVPRPPHRPGHQVAPAGQDGVGTPARTPPAGSLAYRAARGTSGQRMSHVFPAA
jgi:hypothetical protein